MGIARRLIRLFLYGIGLYVVTFIVIAGFTALWVNPDNPRADVIVCLGAGMDADGTLHAPAIKRVQTCADLYAAGAAPRVHFTGGRRVPNGPGAGDQMAALAISLGVPETAISRENASWSTLQNALFSKPILDNADSILIVTEAFHLPRSVASFGFFMDHDMTYYMSEPIRLTTDGRWQWRMIRREAAAMWFNMLRAGVWWVGGLWGAENRDDWLA